jgi:NAD-dependent deacetylase
MISERVSDLVERAQELLLSARHAVALTGAGISTPSGIPDFRSPASGLWQHADPMQVASLFAFQQRPQDFYDWIHPLAEVTLAARPNAAHYALAQMESHGPLRAVITQNIDMLHSKAGSERIIEIHGHLREMTCLRCYEIVPATAIFQQFLVTGEVPRCHCGGVLKPNVILFGEQLPVRAMQASKRETIQSDLMLVAGSSLEVAPAGDLPLLARQTGARLIIVNLEPTHVDEMADVVIRADVVEILPRLAAPFQSTAQA